MLTYQVLVDDIKAMGIEQAFGQTNEDIAWFATALHRADILF